MTEPFADRLARLVEERRSQLVLGLDPDPAALWPMALEGGPGAEAGGSAAELTAAAVARHCRAAIDAAGPACVAVKLQLACFERLGAPGWAALTDAAEGEGAGGVLVVAGGQSGGGSVPACACAPTLLV
ncbi:MAG: hypothetical protein ACR2KY_06020, partial [Thermoleophilaceae bacterium]